MRQRHLVSPTPRHLVHGAPGEVLHHLGELAGAMVAALLAGFLLLLFLRAARLRFTDEFAALAAARVTRLFARARSAGLSLLLGTQSLADLRSADPEDRSDTFTEKVLTNVSYAVVHREADPDSAERLARLAGTRASWSVTERLGPSPGWQGWFRREGTRTREREFVVGPDEFKRLTPGRAVVINPVADPPAEIVGVWPARERAGG